ncbi:transposase, IS4 family [Collimonas sp. OK607]|uniref:IS5 family transposase n=1 Tax=Collimonas sp. OK607 TaxID=1798194 RepID=UPI0008E83DB3|nr:IS5 family transposase [Collimonas sp. OK607]SFB34743.1 transposase, IS4 family [Collimonas sp. OK607]
MTQQTLAMAADQGAGFEQHRKPTRREVFLDTIGKIVPWQELCAVVEPHYPKRGNGRPPIGLERMLRIHFIQHWFNLADFACEDTLYDSASLRRFVGNSVYRVGRVLQDSGMTLKTGTIVDATIIAAPSSTKNSKQERDPEMRQTRKGKQWYFGMKLHIGVDSQSGLTHSAVVTSANVHDKHPLPDLLHGQEQRVCGDNAYASQKVLIHCKAPNARDFTNQRTRKSGEIDEVARGKNRDKSKIRSRVEHVFAVVKRLWGFTKVRYRGLAKNATRAFTALALANLYLSRRHFLAQVRP